MSTYTDASLIVTPNAYKAGKLYSLKPTDGSADLDVVRATTATYVDADGVIQTALANEPRLDYTNGSCPSILVEPQRTNLATYSEQFDNASWIKTRCVITSNDIISPNGNLTTDKFTETIFTNNFSGLEKQITVTSGTSYSLSAFFKKGNVRYVSNGYFIVGGNQGRIIVDLDTKELTYSLNVSSYKIEEFLNDYVRLSITFTANASAACYFNYSHTKISNNINYNADGTGFTYIWGAQLEAGANATSYIPTVASTVTRNVDVISKTGLSGITSITETFENGTTNVISGSPTSYTMSQGRIKHVIGL